MSEPIPPGTLDMLILTTLAFRARLHGFEIAEAIHERSANLLQVKSLGSRDSGRYPARLLIGMTAVDAGVRRAAAARGSRIVKIVSRCMSLNKSRV